MYLYNEHTLNCIVFKTTSCTALSWELDVVVCNNKYFFTAYYLQIFFLQIFTEDDETKYDDEDDDDIIEITPLEPVITEIIDDEEMESTETKEIENKETEKTPNESLGNESDIEIQEPNIPITDLDEIEDKIPSETDKPFEAVKIKKEPKDDDEYNAADAFGDDAFEEVGILALNDDSEKEPGKILKFFLI